MSANSARHRAARSNSISSAARGDTGFSEEEDEEEGNHRRRITEQEEATPPDEEEEEEDPEHEEDPITLKDRQSLINVEHPFGLRIWKPALYKKSRSVTRYADQALHSVPSAQAERHLLPGNIFWVVFFGWWLSLSCMVISALLYLIPYGGKQYATLVYGLGWYIAWPFGKYVEGDLHTDEEQGSLEEDAQENTTDDGSSTPRVAHTQSTITPRTAGIQHNLSSSWNSIPNEETSLLSTTSIVQSRHPKSYGTASPFSSTESDDSVENSANYFLGKACFWLALICVIAPLMLIVCIICWAAVFTIPMAKLNWALIKHLFQHPTSIRFCSAPAGIAVPVLSPEAIDDDSSTTPTPSAFTVKRARLSAGQAAPSGSPTSTVLLCIYRATGVQYYKYTVGGVNIFFVNLMPIVFLVILDGWLLLPFVEDRHEAGKHVPALIDFLASRALIFILCLASVIPLSYFIGMAVASISAQSSIGMGAVINATFGSLIEILLYSFALTEGKGRLVEGSIVGSLLAGVLLMPGMSMCASAVRRKEQKFNSKSAGVTSMMLIMAFIGTLAPTLFYQTYGSFTLICDQCPPHSPEGEVSWRCGHCYYQHPDPMEDPFYQSTVKHLMFFCAGVLLFSYLIGLWFSLRTHASQIWQNPRQLLHPEFPNSAPPRVSIYQKLVPGVTNRVPSSLNRKPSLVNTLRTSRSTTPVPKVHEPAPSERRVSYAVPSSSHPASYSPLFETVDHAIQNTGLQSMQLPENMTRDDFTRAVAVATVSALRHQEAHPNTASRLRTSAAEAEEAGGHSGHDAPSWSRILSASVLLGCTALYAIIAELLVDVVDVVLEGSGIDEKFLGVTLFALVPNTTEFMNAISFALNGNIALSMEIGSAYALQVCLLQIPAMVAFSAWFAPDKLGSVADTFTLIFPRWDVIVIILSVFLMTYTYIEAKSNYHRGSILILSYLVLTAGFYLAPNADPTEPAVHIPANLSPLQAFGQFFAIW